MMFCFNCYKEIIEEFTIVKLVIISTHETVSRAEMLCEKCRRKLMSGKLAMRFRKNDQECGDVIDRAIDNINSSKGGD